jgi:hypothetical protein
MVTVREDGRERRITAAEAFLLQLTKKGLEGDSSAARACLEALEAARLKRGSTDRVSAVTRIIFTSFTVGTSLRTLGLAVKLNPLSKEKVCWKLQPWIVEAALARLGSRKLTIVEQQTIVEATRAPEKVRWPDWWTVFT